MKPFRIFIIIISILFLNSSCNNGTPSQEEQKTENNNTRPQAPAKSYFQLFQLDGRLVRMENYQEKPYIIALWNTQDNQSIDNLKQLAELKEKYGAKINIIAVSEEHVSKHIQFKNKSKFPFDFCKVNLLQKGQKTATNYLFDQTGNFVSEIKPNSYIAIEKQLDE